VKICYLHIGSEKTGSTSIQDFLIRNESQLSTSGIYLPKSLGRPNNRRLAAYFTSRMDDYHYSRGVEDAVQKKNHFRNVERNVCGDFEAGMSRHDAAVITSEHLHSRLRTRVEIHRLHNFLHQIFDDVSVICYFRRQLDMAVSQYSTALRGGYRGSLERFVEDATPENYHYNFLKVAQNWSSVFGIENCDFRIFPPRALSSSDTVSDVRKDFLTAISVDHVAWEKLTFGRSVNEALPANYVTAYRTINTLLPCKQKGRRTLWRRTSRALNLRAKAAYGRLISRRGKIAHSRPQDIDARFDEVNRALFDQFFGGTRYF